MVDLPLGRTATLVPELAVKDLPLARTLDDDDSLRTGNEKYNFVSLAKETI